MASDSLWLGIDLGTTSVKVVLVDIYGNSVISQSCQTNAQMKSDVGSQGYEQNPSKIFETVQDLVLPLIDDKKQKLQGIGITGQMHGVVMWKQTVGKDNEPESLEKACHGHSSNLYTWQDQRCTPDFLASLPAESNQFQSLSTGYGCATLFWLSKNRPDFLQSSGFTCCGTIMDYLAAVLCGLTHPVTCDQLAASLGYYNPTTSTWDSVLYDEDEFPHHLLPKIVPAGSKIGHVTTALKGWPEDVPVYVGMGDVQCAMYAILKNPSDAAVNISTSIQLGFIIPNDDLEMVHQNSPPGLSFFPYFNDCHLALFAGLNGGNAIHHFVECLATWIQDLGIDEHLDTGSMMTKLQKLAENVKDEETDSSLTIRPIFFGERHDPAMKGHIAGMNGANFSRVGVVFKAVSQGMVDHLFSIVSAEYLLKRGVRQLLVSGSVPVNNSLVWQRLKQLYNVDDLRTTMDSDGRDAVGSAVGAARFVRDATVRVSEPAI